MKNRLLLPLVIAGLVLAGAFFYRPAQAASFVYLSPLPGTQVAHPETSLAVREGRPFDPAVLETPAFVVAGSRSGLHSGRTVLSDDRRTLLYYPAEPFAFNETVTVTLLPGLQTADGSPLASLTYTFSTVERALTAAEYAGLPAIAAPDEMPAPPVSDAPAQPPVIYHTHPEFGQLLNTTIITPPQGTAGGYIFLAPINVFGSTTPASMILDETGEPVYVGLTPPGEIAADFKVVQYQGQDHLAYNVGVLNLGWGQGIVHILDDTYTVVETYTIDNGYDADFHDFQVIANDDVLLLGYVPTPYDLSPYGGPVDGIVYDIVIQQQDLSKNVVFEWHGLDYIPLEDSYVNLAISPADYIHSNALELDADGNILLSSRYLSEITKIDRLTGDIIWRLGGKQNDFTFTNDGGFSYQHDIRRLPTGNITLFDNGNQHNPQYSRAVEYAIDENAMTVTRVWQYPDDTSIFGAFMGNVQRLDNGSTFISWGGFPMFNEVLPDGTVAYQVALGDLTYRAFRYEWSAIPSEAPRAALGVTPSLARAQVYMSWNGATGVTGYEIYAGPDTAALSLVATTPSTGFETGIQLTGLDPGTCVFRVRPLHPQVANAPFSNFAYRFDQPACWDLLNQQFFPIMTGEFVP